MPMYWGRYEQGYDNVRFTLIEARDLNDAVQVTAKFPMT